MSTTTISLLLLFLLFLSLISLLFFFFFFRLYSILSPSRPLRSRSSSSKTHICILLGSGGHTAEMIAMLSRATSLSTPSEARLEWKSFAYRTYIVGEEDAISAQRAREFESLRGAEQRSWELRTVPRARRVHQSAWSAPASCVRCLVACVRVLCVRGEGEGSTVGAAGKGSGKVDFPDLILVNGPATAAILVFACVGLRFFDVGGCARRGKLRTVYVESWARVKKASLSGKLVARIVDRFIVQWPGIRKVMGRDVEFMGGLVE